MTGRADYAELWSRLPATADVDWWCAHAAGAPDGRVLYLGAGTGRLALPLAEHCRSLVAVERDAAVADVLRRRLADRPDLADHVLVVESDVRGLASGTEIARDDEAAGARFAGWFGRVLLPSSLLNELLDADDRLAVLRLAAQRCAAEGRVVLQVLNPYWLSDGPPREDGHLQPADGGAPVPVRVSRLESWPWAQRHRLRLVYTLGVAVGPHDVAERMTDELDVVALYPNELRALCRRAGLEIVERWGAVPGVSPLDRTGGTWHLVCRPLALSRATAGRLES